MFKNKNLYRTGVKERKAPLFQGDEEVCRRFEIKKAIF